LIVFKHAFLLFLRAQFRAYPSGNLSTTSGGVSLYLVLFILVRMPCFDMTISQNGSCKTEHASPFQCVFLCILSHMIHSSIVTSIFLRTKKYPYQLDMGQTRKYCDMVTSWLLEVPNLWGLRWYRRVNTKLYGLYYLCFYWL